MTDDRPVNATLVLCPVRTYPNGDTERVQSAADASHWTVYKRISDGTDVALADIYTNESDARMVLSTYEYKYEQSWTGRPLRVLTIEDYGR